MNKDKTVKGHDVSKCTMRLNGALFYIFTVIYFFYNGKSMLLIHMKHVKENNVNKCTLGQRGTSHNAFWTECICLY